MSIVALVTDLLFVSKIKGTADSLGVPLTVARDVGCVMAAVQAGARLVIVDMNVSGADPPQVIHQCKAAPDPPRVIAYLSHVQQDLAAAARNAGADQVLPRSRFSEQLPDILKQGSIVGG